MSSASTTTTTTPLAFVLPKECEVDTKWDRCFENLFTHNLIGFGVGLLSFALVRRTWARATLFGFSVGVANGHAYSWCKYDLSHPLLLHGKKLKGFSPSSLSTNDNAASASSE
ncbi:MICOS complex subunit MIC10 [Balamuthia mandrillaris]